MRRILPVILVLLTFNSPGQQSRPVFRIGVHGGLSTYSFDNLVKANNDVISNQVFSTSIIDNFPDRIFPGGYVLVKINNWWSAGSSYEFHSTGSRVGARDYSGSYHFDQIVSSHQIALENDIQLTHGDKPEVSLVIAGGVNFSAWKTEEYLKVFDEEETQSFEFVASKPFVYPSVKVGYRVPYNCAVFIKGGYLLDLGGSYHVTGNRKQKTDLKIPWNGIRISVGLELNI